MQLTQSLARAAQIHADGVATVYGQRTLSFAQLQQRVATLASALRSLGVRDGDPIAYLGGASERHIECLLAAPWAGATLNAVDPAWPLQRIIDSLHLSQTVAVLVDDLYATHLDALLDGCPFLRFVVFDGLGACPDGLPSLSALLQEATPLADHATSDDAVFASFTAADAAVPPLRISQRALMASVAALLAEGAFARDSIGLVAAPLCELPGAITVAGLLLRGATLVIPSEFSLDAIDAAIDQHAVSELFLSAPLATAMLQARSARPRHPGSLKRLICCVPETGALPTEALLRAFPGVEVLQVYGLAETGSVVAVLSPGELDADAANSALTPLGRSAVNTHLRVVDDTGVETARGSIGQIQAHLIAALRDTVAPELQRDCSSQPQWLSTGDQGQMDARGQLFRAAR